MPTSNFSLLEQLCAIQAPSGHEGPLKDFILNYVVENSHAWKAQPEVIAGENFQDCLILAFGKPRTAIFSHIDSIGFTVRYDNKLVQIGGPDLKTGYPVTGSDSKGKINAKLVFDPETDLLCLDALRPIDPGTELVFAPNFRQTDEYVQNCYLDNRLGVWVCLKLAETLTDGIIVFSCYEEHGGGTVSFLTKYIYEHYQIKQALIADITWVTEGVKPGKGVAISLRDRSIPRRKFVNRIIELATELGVDWQLEVEEHGGSDGKEIQASPYPIDWCFIGAAEQNVHSPDELVYKSDIDSMLKLYQYLMEKL